MYSNVLVVQKVVKSLPSIFKIFHILNVVLPPNTGALVKFKQAKYSEGMLIIKCTCP